MKVYLNFIFAFLTSYIYSINHGAPLFFPSYIYSINHGTPIWYFLSSTKRNKF